MKKKHIYEWSVLIIGLCLMISPLVLANADDDLEVYYAQQMQGPDYLTVKARVLEIPYDDTGVDKPGVPRVSDIRYQHLKLKIISGSHRGEVFTVKNTIEMVNPYKLMINRGDTILLRLYENREGRVENLVVYERSRENQLLVLIMLFLLLLVIIGGVKGVKSVLTLALTAAAVIWVLLPMILAGWNPVFASTGVGVAIAGLTLVMVSGWNRKTLNAFLGTVGGVLIAGVLALAAGAVTGLTGLGNEDAQLLAYIPQHMNIDYRGLLFAGIIIGALGAVMDVAMSVASAMWELTRVQPAIALKALVKSGMNIGKDTMGTMANTLILAYAGGAIHIMLLLMAFKVPLLEIVNMDFMASEIIRAIAGSIGLVCAIPLTVTLSGMFHPKTKTRVSAGRSRRSGQRSAKGKRGYPGKA